MYTLSVADDVPKNFPSDSTSIELTEQSEVSQSFARLLEVLAGNGSEPLVVCGMGCGARKLLSHIYERGITNISFIGVEKSDCQNASSNRNPPTATFVDVDITSHFADLKPLECDYLIISALHNLKSGGSPKNLWTLLESTLRALWPYVRRGIIFRGASAPTDACLELEAPMENVVALLHELADCRVSISVNDGRDHYTAYAWRGEAAVDLLPSNGRMDSLLDSNVPVMRPLMPTAEKLLPYLHRIDSARTYTNFGPLVLEFERRLVQHFGMPRGGIVSASSGTLALVGAILASAGRATSERPYALIPAFTFVATAVAVEQCGYQAYLADVDIDSWMLDAERLRAHPELGRIGVVIPVSPFGRPVPQAPWQKFRDKTGIPVVIDGAASFETISNCPERHLGELPVMLSLHATKSFAAGEGGCVLSTDPSLIVRTGQALNFGFFSARNSLAASTNGKMSEYHAAVGLAEFDGWEVKKSALLAVAENYQRLLSRAGLSGRCLTAPKVCSSYTIFRCRSAAESLQVQGALRRHGIGFRLWYGNGLQHQSYFSHSRSEALTATEQVAPCLLGLPMAPDLDAAVIGRVVAALSEGLAEK